MKIQFNFQHRILIFLKENQNFLHEDQINSTLVKNNPCNTKCHHLRYQQLIFRKVILNKFPLINLDIQNHHLFITKT